MAAYLCWCEGSVLGPLLFLVFINDLFDVVSNNLDIFADDSSLWSVVKKGEREQVARSLNQDLLVIQSWATKWIVTYNHTKTELVTISNKDDMSVFHKNGLHKKGFYNATPTECPHPPLCFFGSVIPERPHVKIVGVTLTNNMSWNTHVNNISSKAKRGLALLRRGKRVLNKSALATIYKSYVRSQMEYCSPLWAGASKSSLERLDNVQKCAAKIIGRDEASNLQSLGHRRGISALCTMHRLLFKRAPAPLHVLIPKSLPERRQSARLKFPRTLNPPPVHRPAFYLSSFIPKLTNIWNTTVPPDVRKITSPTLFKSKIKFGEDLSFAF